MKNFISMWAAWLKVILESSQRQIGKKKETYRKKDFLYHPEGEKNSTYLKFAMSFWEF